MLLQLFQAFSNLPRQKLENLGGGLSGDEVLPSSPGLDGGHSEYGQAHGGSGSWPGP